MKNRGKETPVHKLTRTCSIEASHRASISRQRTAGKCRSFLDAQSSGSPHAVASAPRAEAPDKPGRAPGPMNRRLRIPFQYPQCQRARRFSGGFSQSAAHKMNLRKRERPAGPSAQPRTRVICGAAVRCQTLSPSFLRFLFAVARMPHLLPRDRRPDISSAAPGDAFGAAPELLSRKNRAEFVRPGQGLRPLNGLCRRNGGHGGAAGDTRSGRRRAAIPRLTIRHG